MARPQGLQCAGCGRSEPVGTAPATRCGCGAPLLARYDLEAARVALRPDRLADRPVTLWRYAEVLPEVPPVSLGEGWTPLVAAPRIGAELGLRRLYIKDEAVNPTGSFKARGMAVAVSVLAAQGVGVVAAPSAGNAGTALAAYGARAGMEVHLFFPETTPRPFLEEAGRFGARVRTVPGSIAEAARLMRETMGGVAGRRGWFDLSTLHEPYRVEGKKTMGYELWEQLGGVLPGVILYPAGGGTGLIGMWKAFEEMQALGWIGVERPRMMAVQAAGCAPIVRAFEAGESRARPWDDPVTVASGLRVPASLGDGLMLRAVRDSGGTALAVTDREMIAEVARIGSAEGIDACPEGGATLAGLRRLRASGAVGSGDIVVAFNTGTGLKYAV
jgi:threonine synthase